MFSNNIRNFAVTWYPRGQAPWSLLFWCFAFLVGSHASHGHKARGVTNINQTNYVNNACGSEVANLNKVIEPPLGLPLWI